MNVEKLRSQLQTACKEHQEDFRELGWQADSWRAGCGILSYIITVCAAQLPPGARALWHHSLAGCLASVWLQNLGNLDWSDKDRQQAEQAVKAVMLGLPPLFQREKTPDGPPSPK